MIKTGLLFLIPAFVFVAGCGSSVETGSTGSGGGSTTSGSTGSGGACAAYTDQAGAGKVTVHFLNKTGQPVYLSGTCAGSFSYSITNIGGADAAYVYDGSCLQTCADLQKEPPFACGPCLPQAIRLDPGAVRELEWDGTGLVMPSTPMPASCYAPGGGAFPSCQQIIAAPAGMYRAEAIGFSECGPGCTCDASGVCNGAATGIQAIATPTKFGFPGTSSIDVVFDGCAFGCPSP